MQLIKPCGEKTCLQGFMTRAYTNQATQPQKMARGLKFWTQEKRVILLSM